MGGMWGRFEIYTPPFPPEIALRPNEGGRGGGVVYDVFRDHFAVSKAPFCLLGTWQVLLL